MNLRKLILTNNDCYKAGRTIKPKGIMVHSTGANNPWLKRYVGPDDGLLGKNQYNNHWNMGGVGACVHAFIGKLADGSIATYQTLPWNQRGWHCAGKGNDTHISFEICEDDLTNRAYFDLVYKEAVELCVYLCKKFNLNPLADGVLICHSEGHKRGIASNHSDVMHWFPKHGKSMDTFRAEVKAGLSAPPVATGLYYVQTGAYSVKANADAQYRKVKAAGFDALIKKAGNLYRVQVGAFAVKANAEALAAKLKQKGFDTYITKTGGTSVGVGTPTKKIGVGSKVKIKSGASKYSTGERIPGWVKNKTYTVQQVGSGKVLLKEIMSWVNLVDVTL